MGVNMSASFYDLQPTTCDACRTTSAELCPAHAAHRDLFNGDIDAISFLSEGQETGGEGHTPLAGGEGLGFDASNIAAQNQVRIACALENMNDLLTTLSRTLTAINETLKKKKK